MQMNPIGEFTVVGEIITILLTWEHFPLLDQLRQAIIISRTCSWQTKERIERLPARIPRIRTHWTVTERFLLGWISHLPRLTLQSLSGLRRRGRARRWWNHYQNAWWRRKSTSYYGSQSSPKRRPTWDRKAFFRPSYEQFHQWFKFLNEIKLFGLLLVVWSCKCKVRSSIYCKCMVLTFFFFILMAIAKFSFPYKLVRENTEAHLFPCRHCIKRPSCKVIVSSTVESFA